MRVVFYLVTAALLLASIELTAGLGFAVGLILPETIFRTEYFDCNGCKAIENISDKDLPSGPNPLLGWSLYDRDLGWDSYRNGKRNIPRVFERQCASAFGDSFVHGDEVNDDKAWAYLLSVQLGCEVENFGVGGYGLDQAFLKYLKYRPKGDLVVVGVTQETLRRNLAASWRFYGSIPNSLPKPFFRLSGDDLLLEKPPANLDRMSIRKHHRFDRYARPFVVQFPYSAALLRVLYYRTFSDAWRLNRVEPYESAWTHPDARALSFRILQRFAKVVSQDEKKIIFLIVPNADGVAQDRKVYADYVGELAMLIPNVCIVDAFPILRAKFGAVGSLKAPKQHFNEFGNEAIASALFGAIGSYPACTAN
jgi:hypothetical protein